jgi:hypothetical protein
MTGTNLIITFFMLISLNGFFALIKIPILAFSIGFISLIFLLGFSIDFSGVNIILSLILLVMSVYSMFINFKDYRR